jgi:transposase-like protein
MLNAKKPRTKIGKALRALSLTTPRHGRITEVARSFRVCRSTLSRAFRKVAEARQASVEQENPRLLERATRLTEPRGASSNKLLTDQEELAAIGRLRNDWPHGFTNRIIHNVCVELTRNLRSKPRKWSRCWLEAFKRRAGIISSKFRVRKRIALDPDRTFDADVEAACFYLEDVETYAQSIPLDLIINVDETPSYVRNAPSTALHFVDTDGPWAWSRISERDKVTVIGACTGAGSMLKPGIIARGTTTRCQARYEKKIGHSAFIQHNQSGLTNTESFIEYIQSVILPFTQDRNAVLIVDAWGAHLTDPVREFCSSHHLSMVQVPERGTSILQPLDVGVFSVAKTNIYSQAKEEFFELIRQEEDRWAATATCVRALNRVSRRAVQHGWKSVFPSWEELLERNNLNVQ